MLKNTEYSIILISIFRMSGSAKNKHRTIPPFLRKTLQILQDPSNRQIACWAPDGKGFSILQEQAFAQQVLPRFFKHNNYSSFVRQLNMYNFHKIRDGGTESYFYHELFQREHLDQICDIQRKPQRKKRKCRDYESDEESREKVLTRSVKVHKDSSTKASVEEPKSSFHILARQTADDQISIDDAVEEPLLIQPALGTRELMCPSRGNIYMMINHSEPMSVYSLTNLIR